MAAGRLPRSQRLATAAGSLESICSGGGSCRIVLLGGAGVPLEGWARLFPAVERIGRVFACNRFGLGRSSRPRLPQTGTVVVDAVREALRQSGMAPPYLLVGHSLGGLHAQLFARRHAHEVGGVVLLEATHPRDRGLLKGHEAHLARALSRLLDLPQQQLRANLHAELDWVDATAAEVESAGPFPPVPLLVVTGRIDPPTWLVPPHALRLRRANQQALARLSPQGRQVLARRSGHFPQWTEPALVLDVLRHIAAQVD